MNSIFKTNVLDDIGYVELLDMMPHELGMAEMAVVSAARTSYLSDSKGTEKDKKLLHFLLKHKHCYAGHMEVLTTSGWKRWDSLNDFEEFVVPDGKGNYIFERLKTQQYEYSEEMETFKNSRMSYSVTPDHKLWYKNRNSDEFYKVKAKELRDGNKIWLGHFQTTLGMIPKIVKGGFADYDKACFVGFFLGDGSYGSYNRVSFHLKKDRKKKYLRELLAKNGIKFKESPSSTHADAIVFWVEIPDFLREAVGDITAKASDKIINDKYIDYSNIYQLQGLFDGLINSDGSIKKDRPQIKFASNSDKLLSQVELIGALLGLECHKNKNIVNIYTQDSRVSLESRPQYYSTNKNNSDRVYCTTTSTGLLIVRGKSNSWSFICGNSSPFEQVTFKFKVYAPAVTFWQWVRHRTAAYNFSSGRYMEFEADKFYVPKSNEWRLQSQNGNKQMSDGFLDTTLGAAYTDQMNEIIYNSYKLYNQMLHDGVAREQARLVLPCFAAYYTCVYSVSSHNLIHFLRLRLAKEAQYEIRAYARAQYEMFKKVMPWTAEYLETNEVSPWIENGT